MAHSKKSAKSKRPFRSQHRIYVMGKPFFPNGSINKLFDKIKDVHRDMAPSIRTVEDVLYGFKKDRYGIMPIYQAMTKATQAALNVKVAELNTEP